MKQMILVVDDDVRMRIGVAEVLARGGYEVEQASDGRAGLDALTRRLPDLVVSDMRMPGMSGSELLARIQERWPGLPVVLITAYGTVEDAVAAMKCGAREFLTKPFSPQDLLHLVGGILEDGLAEAPSRSPRTERAIVTRSPALQRVIEMGAGVAASRAPVLVQGESGTGKELFARFLHEAGPRAGQAFVAVNCAALPRELLESELFGHEKGAFTGAANRKLGRFELAHRGTLLLDEISEMELGLQAKLLRVLQEREIDRLGGSRPIPIDARVVATTNRDLRAMVAAGEFRRDLYYRLNVVPLTLPPLRERREDIDLLTDHFLARFAAGTRLRIEEEARVCLREHVWPGNVRELEHTIERAVLLTSDGVIRAADVAVEDEPIALAATAAAEPVAAELAGRTVHEVERELIVQTLHKTRNNRTHAARLLGISVRTLRNKLAEYRGSGLLEAGLS